MMDSDKVPMNSIGVFKSEEGWVYWYWDEHIWDTGVKKSEELALRTAKLNIR
jgi:hypothetical protein